MVDVSQKADTERVAVAEGFISMKPETLALIVEGKAAKGDARPRLRPGGRSDGREENEQGLSPCATR